MQCLLVKVVVAKRLLLGIFTIVALYSHLFDSQNINNLKSMCRYVKSNVMYSDVLKKSQISDVEKQSNKTFVKCFGKTPDHDKIAKGKNVKLYSFSIESPKKSIIKHEMSKDQCVPHMCRDMNNSIENKSKHEVKVSQFVDVNPYEILADIDFSDVNTCQPVNVNNVVLESDGETCHEASVLMKNGRNLTKGKKNQSIKGPKGSNGPSKIGVSRDTGMQVLAGCQVENGAVSPFISNATAVDLNDSDRYELEIQTKLKKSKIQVAKGHLKIKSTYSKIDHYLASYLFMG